MLPQTKEQVIALLREAKDTKIDSKPQQLSVRGDIYAASQAMQNPALVSETALDYLAQMARKSDDYAVQSKAIHSLGCIGRWHNKDIADIALQKLARVPWQSRIEDIREIAVAYVGAIGCKYPELGQTTLDTLSTFEQHSADKRVHETAKWWIKAIEDKYSIKPQPPSNIIKFP